MKKNIYMCFPFPPTAVIYISLQEMLNLRQQEYGTFL